MPALVAPASPFTSLYEVGDGVGGVERNVSTINAFAAELYDDEFTEALHELMAEVIEAQDQIARELGSVQARGPEGEQRLERFVDNVALELQRLLEAVEDRSGGRDLTDSEVDSIISAYVPAALLTPQMQHFLHRAAKSLWKKAKKAASTVVKTVAKTALGPVLRKLGSLAQPLLQRVLKMAIGKLPPAVQPIAKQLAAKYVKVSVDGEVSDETPDAAVNAPGLQREFDYLFASLATAETDIDNEVLMRGYTGEADDAVERLHEARTRFVSYHRKVGGNRYTYDRSGF